MGRVCLPRRRPGDLRGVAAPITGHIYHLPSTFYLISTHIYPFIVLNIISFLKIHLHISVLRENENLTIVVSNQLRRLKYERVNVNKTVVVTF